MLDHNHKPKPVLSKSLKSNMKHRPKPKICRGKASTSNSIYNYLLKMESNPLYPELNLSRQTEPDKTDITELQFPTS